MCCDPNTAAKGYRPVGKVVDLLEYRRWLAMEQAWEEPVSQSGEWEGEIVAAECVSAPRPLRRRSRHRRRWMGPDFWAAAAVAVMALTFTVRMLFL